MRKLFALVGVLGVMAGWSGQVWAEPNDFYGAWGAGGGKCSEWLAVTPKVFYPNPQNTAAWMYVSWIQGELSGLTNASQYAASRGISLPILPGVPETSDKMVGKIYQECQKHPDWVIVSTTMTVWEEEIKHGSK